MLKCPKCGATLVEDSDGRYFCPMGCKLTINSSKTDSVENNTHLNMPDSTNNSFLNERKESGNKLQVASMIYFAIGAIAYIVLAAISFSAGDKLSGFVYIGSILEVAFYSAIAYTVGGTFNVAYHNSHSVKENRTIVAQNQELLNKCIEKINMQSKCILELAKEIEALKKEINK